MRQLYVLTALLFVFTATAAQGIQDGLVFYTPFDGATVNLVEWGKPVNHGAAFVADKFGNPNRAIAFDGEGDYLDYGDILDLGRQNFSISIWVKADGFYQGARYGLGGKVINKGLGADNYRGFGVRAVNFNDSGNNFRFMTADGKEKDGTPIVQYTDKFGLEEGEWYHLVLTRFGNLTQLYLNNQLIVTGLSPKAAHVDSDAPFTIGGMLTETNGKAEQFFHGQLDEVRIYNRRLSKRDISILYDQFINGGVDSHSAEKAVAEIPMDMKVYPNPASRILHLEFDRATERKISILSIDGRRIRYMKIQGEKEEIPVSGLTPGTYFVRVEEGDKLMVKRFLKVGLVLP